MKNTDYLVYLTTKTGVTTRFARDQEGWVQTAPSGIKRRCTAEQVLNHLLPALVLGDSILSTKVTLKRGRRFHPSIEGLRKGRKRAAPSRPAVLGPARRERLLAQGGHDRPA